jgi:hypothetical protein
MRGPDQVTRARADSSRLEELQAQRKMLRVFQGQAGRVGKTAFVVVEHPGGSLDVCTSIGVLGLRLYKSWNKTPRLFWQG